ncbi:PQQ-dependent sugar dehydrogenase [Mucilaginibacter antarcticus]|uniref:PQQ-dependent sugar dehydrogenase n=1 Tax=Mucilaginibacter antarcticus TaxID=1855725 RepID=UPI0036262BA8
MVFDKDKNLYLSTGDNTFSRASDGFSPLDERPNMSTQDSQKGSSNTDDLRGKILRIHPEPNGTYTIPKGNLFAKGTPKTRPEIYTMGNRNPWRLSIDSRTGYLYWGEVGPDGSVDDFEKRGPQSYDEFNQAKKPAITAGRILSVIIFRTINIISLPKKVALCLILKNRLTHRQTVAA